MSTQPPSGGVQATAQLALSHTQFPSDRPRRQKEEMLNGRQYYPFDKELVLERERCNAACWRFNNSTNPNLGVSPAERARLFRDILHPREGVQLSPTMVSPVTHAGRVGENATVEAPFNCDYGYNIHIGNNVAIGRNCLINDVCEVRIGNNVIISPNVSIYTGTCSTNPLMRRGNQGTQYGKPVIIEDDVWIAANVVILPGVRIGKGSTVGAGSVVTRVSFVFVVSLEMEDSQPCLLTDRFDAGRRHLECLHGPQGRPPQGYCSCLNFLSVAGWIFFFFINLIPFDLNLSTPPTPTTILLLCCA
jgi:acetyltransferase-like isoleucine patch superfamily enzyme